MNIDAEVRQYIELNKKLGHYLLAFGNDKTKSEGEILKWLSKKEERDRGHCVEDQQQLCEH